MKNKDTHVTYGISYTKNLGNFESLKVNVQVEDQVGDEETVRQAYARIKKFVDERLEEAVLEIAKDLQ